MSKKVIFSCILVAYCCTALWAAGRKDNVSRTAEDPSGFTDFIETSDRTPGKYNYFLEAKDKAGNTTIAGPENIFIDPESDLPRVTIINPTPDMLVQGNLNIVGLAIDDDGIDFVELVITRRNKNSMGEEILRTRAEGAESWSYFLDTTNNAIWTDGLYTVTAWAVDINGLSGVASLYPNGTKVPVKAHKLHQVSWHLDRQKPEIAVTSHKVGALVSDKIRLKGTVADGNGIDTLSYSIDEGNSYTPAKIKLDKKTGLYHWDITINTKKLNDGKDGPAVIWLQAEDGQHSLGTMAHLLFINNDGPDVQIVYPQPTEAVNGVFTIAGYASHPVGIKSVSWKAGKASGEFDMVIGNPWWSADIDLRGSRSSSIEIRIEAIDVSGKPTVRKQKYKVDQKAGLPIVTLHEPAAGVEVGNDGNLIVTGSVTDNNGVASVFYALGADPAVEIPCSGFFQFIISNIPEGIHNLDVWAKDAAGVMGPKVRVKGIIAPERLPGSRGPSITLRDAPRGQWVQTSVPVTFNISASNNIRGVTYSADMGTTWKDLLSPEEIAALGTPVNADITRTLDITSAEDGGITILIRAVNESNHVSVVNFTVVKDTQAPEASLIMPIADVKVNGTIRMGFAIKEAGQLKSVTYHRPAFSPEGKADINTEVFNVTQWDKDYPPMFLEIPMDSIEMPLDETMYFTFEDMAGNTSVFDFWPFIIDAESDKPVVRIILPAENEVITTDFTIMGIAIDDDAIKQVHWKIDDGEEYAFVTENGFSIPVSIASLTDNKHTVTITAEDIYGIKSDPVTRNFRVSLSEPVAEILYPDSDIAMKDVVEIKGTAFDENGIEKVYISLDNGITFNPVVGTTEWSYHFNTKILQDGPHMVFLRVWDSYGIPATYSRLIRVDNTPPELALDSPDDDFISTGTISIRGRAIDPNLKEITIELRSLEGKEILEDIRTRKLEPNSIIMEEFDFNNQEDGLYNIEVIATDIAGNSTRISRNVALIREKTKNFVEILYPLENETIQGIFNLYGYAGGADKAATVIIKINGADQLMRKVDDSGFFRISLNASHLNSGKNTISVYSHFGGSDEIESNTQTIFYNAEGPWITIDSMNVGDFVFDRPYLYGRMGYNLTAEEQQILADKKADKKQRALIRAKTASYAEISFDNGKTFVKAGRGRDKETMDYRYRLETGDMAEGMHYILVKATMKNGEIATTRMLVQVDKTPPVIRLITPEVSGRYNKKVPYSAFASDDIELVSLEYHLRKGDKAAYGVPGFIQGLYIEGIIPPFIKQISNDAPVMPFGGGATYTDFGLGLSFFDDNVKIQAQYGFLTQNIWESMGGTGAVRYGGHVLGLKLLASIYTLPFGSFAGPDWEWLSASLALGANFSFFDIGNNGYTQSGKSTWMSALLAQVEFPKVTIPKRTFLRTFSLFTEGQLWFVPTDVNADNYKIETVIPHITVGLRAYIF
ncbi:MAG: Ig-like domain-containing protein [Treponema sp.]|nr:Ig-like domain-containing protein [Treponema sp.]